MYYVQWEDNILSEDMYNLSRANNHLKVLTDDGFYDAPEKPLEARTDVSVGYKLLPYLEYFNGLLGQFQKWRKK